jgi:hypothetical protein
MEVWMQILLTGGSGSVGKSVVDRLVNHGYRVRVIGRKTDVQIEGAEYQSCDITDFPHLRETIRGCEAVVHLAAIPNPGMAKPQGVFEANCQGTFNVYQAAAEEGIKRIVQASSINAAGQFYGVKPAPLHYLPMDEEHPVFSTDAYSFSKHVIEEIGDYFWRREGISSVAYRLPYVAPPSYHEAVIQNRIRIQNLVDGLLKHSVDERQAWFENAWNAYNDFRSRRPFETSGYARQYVSELPEDTKNAFMAMGWRVNFYTVLDERDSAQAIEKGLTANFEGSHTLFINDSKNWTGVPSKDLAALFYADVNAFKHPLAGTESLVSIEAARRLIQFEPEYSFEEG